MLNKARLRAAILAQLEADLAQQTAAAHLARDEAISEESRPENKYDTHSQEAAYLAEGQARLAKEIAESISAYTNLALPEFPAGAPAASGAVATLANGRSRSLYFIGPRAGGLAVNVGDVEVLLITPQSPLGRELVGKRVGESIRLPGRSTPLEIVAIE